MSAQEILQLIIAILAIGGSVFGVFNFFRKPQIKSEVNDAVFNEMVKGLKKETDIKYDSIKELVINLRDNHMHTIDLKLDKHIENDDSFQRDVCGKLGGIQATLDILIKK